MNVFAAAVVLPDGSVLSNARIAVRDGVIMEVSGNAAACPRGPGDVELGDVTLFPGFTNAHCHLELTSLGALPREKFVPWVRELMRRKADLTEEAVAAGIRDGTKRLLRTGVTTVLDHVSPATPLACFRELPVRVIGFGEVLSVNEVRSRASWETWRGSRDQAPIAIHPTPHSGYSIHAGVLREFQRSEPGPFSIHVLESAEERAWFDAGTGPLAEFLLGFDAELTRLSASIWDLLFENGLPHDALLVHGNELCASDFETLTRARNACVVHCPGSFDFFGHARFPFEELRRRGIPTALGTDSLASNDALDYLREIRLFLVRHPGLAFPELLPMLTTNALHAIGIRDSGRIAVGCRADLIGFANPHGKSPLEILKTADKTDFAMVGGTIAEIPKF